ncbi:MutS-related protein [Ancylomarina sp. YFZ004]
MNFGTDKQTKQDLNLFSKQKGDLSVFDYYNRTKTKGGCLALETLMESPSCDLNEINQRIETIRFISEHQVKYEFDKDALDFIEHYLNQNTDILRSNVIDSSLSWLKNKIQPTNEYYIITRGLEYLKGYIQDLSFLVNGFNQTEVPVFFINLIQIVREFEALPSIKKILNPKHVKFSSLELSHLDNLIRSNEKERVLELLRLTYQLDAYMSLAETAADKNLAFPEFSESDTPYLNIKGFYHPFLEAPIANDIETDSHQNLCFVSGANMAGKSTFLKSIGLCLYLAHIGFPVPAKSMNSSIFKGLYSTINISDDIEKGHSHYYSEVKRVKEVALQIKDKKNVFVIFDELFRGTNVKDAYDATLLVTSGFVKIKSSLFFISTHIVEVGHELEKLEGTCFKCFSSCLEEGKPKYDYKLEEGISSERLGLTIVENENIMEIIEEIVADSAVKV